MRLGTLLALGIATGARAARSGCPCITAFPAGVNPSDGVTIGGTSIGPGIYPTTYGLSSCSTHDANLPPVCDRSSNVPVWCADQWCYVDPNACDQPVTSSSYFPGNTLYFSYFTCGSSNTFDSWFGSLDPGSGAGSGEVQTPGSAPASPPHVVGDLVTVIHDYLISLSSTVEENEPEIRTMTSCTSGAPPSCPCATCARNTNEAAFWTNMSFTLGTNSTPLSAFDFSTVSLTPKGSPTSTDGVVETCLSGYLENAFLRVAAREASITNRIGYEYGAFQAQGSYVQWPATDWCPSNYDPRFRSWYVSAASGPKDVVIVLDVSGSMRNLNRMNIATTAALRLLDTFTAVDHVGMVQFSASAQAALGATTLYQATPANIAALKGWVRSLSAGGTTNFVGAFDVALRLLEDSNPDFTSACSKAILFLSDGIPDAWSGNDAYSVQTRATALGANIFTYALGSGAQSATLKSVACQNSGAHWSVADGGNLADAMADYYTFLAPLQESCQVRWTYYTDFSTNVPLLAACLASYKKQTASSSTSCSEPNPSCMPELLGVMCMDVEMIATQQVISARSDGQGFYDRVTADQVVCNKRTASPAQLQALRARINPSFGNAVCEDHDLNGVAAADASSCDSSGSGGGGGNSTGGSEGGSPAGTFLGIGVAGFFFLILVALGVWCACCKSKPSKAASGAQATRPVQAAPPMGQAIGQVSAGVQMQPVQPQPGYGYPPQATPVGGGYAQQPAYGGYAQQPQPAYGGFVQPTQPAYGGQAPVPVVMATPVA